MVDTNLQLALKHLYLSWPLQIDNLWSDFSQFYFFRKMGNRNNLWKFWYHRFVVSEVPLVSKFDGHYTFLYFTLFYKAQTMNLLRVFLAKKTRNIRQRCKRLQNCSACVNMRLPVHIWSSIYDTLYGCGDSHRANIQQRRKHGRLKHKKVWQLWSVHYDVDW